MLEMIDPSYWREVRKKIANISSVASNYADIELQYLSALQQNVVKDFFYILVGGFVLALLIALTVTMLLVTLIFGIMELFPTVTNFQVVATATGSILVVTIVTAFLAFGAVKHVRKIVTDYLVHWKTNHEEHTIT